MKLLLNQAANWFAMVQDNKGTRSWYDHLGSIQRLRRKKCVYSENLERQTCFLLQKRDHPKA